jgi:hypothetical protein
VRYRIWLLVSMLLGILIVGAAFAAAKTAVSGLNGDGWAGGSAADSVRPGQDSDTTVSIRNRTGHAVILESATLMKVAYYKSPHLRNVAVESGRSVVAAGRGWPPTVQGIRRFHGFRVANDSTVNIAYGVFGERVGDYGTAGIRVKVKTRFGIASVRAFGTLGTCVQKRKALKGCPNSFANSINYASASSSRHHPRDGEITGGVIFLGHRPAWASPHLYQSGTVRLKYRGRTVATSRLQVAGLQFEFGREKPGLYHLSYANAKHGVYCESKVVAKSDHVVSQNVYCHFRPRHRADSA